jgi:hypothetical protein
VANRPDADTLRRISDAERHVGSCFTTHRRSSGRQIRPFFAGALSAGPHPSDATDRLERVTGLEPAASDLEGRRSSQLSYTRVQTTLARTRDEPLTAFVGEGGFEPPTACPQSRCATTAPLPVGSRVRPSGAPAEFHRSPGISPMTCTIGVAGTVTPMAGTLSIDRDDLRQSRRVQARRGESRPLRFKTPMSAA